VRPAWEERPRAAPAGRRARRTQPELRAAAGTAGRAAGEPEGPAQAAPAPEEGVARAAGAADREPAVAQAAGAADREPAVAQAAGAADREPAVARAASEAAGPAARPPAPTIKRCSPTLPWGTGQ
jgi:hypothetical protein